VGQKTVITIGVALALAVTGTPVLAAGGGHSAHHAAKPVTVGRGHKGDTHGHGAGQHVRQFEGRIVALSPDSLDLHLQGSRGVTVTVGISATGTHVSADGVVTTTAALASGEQVHVAAAPTTAGGVTTYTAVRIVIQRRATGTVEADGDTTHDGAPHSTT
jgi:hypothetical protein